MEMRKEHVHVHECFKAGDNIKSRIHVQILKVPSHVIHVIKHAQDTHYS